MRAPHLQFIQRYYKKAWEWFIPQFAV